MPQYEVLDSESGLTVTLEGDSAPTEQDLTDIFDQVRTQRSSASAPSEPDITSTPAQYEPETPDPEKPPGFMEWLSKLGATTQPKPLTDQFQSAYKWAQDDYGVAESQKPMIETDLVPWQLKAAKALKIPGADTLEGLVKSALKPTAGMVSSASSPMGIATLPAMIALPEIMGPLFSVQAVPGLKESAEMIADGIYEKDLNKLIEGTFQGGMDALMVATGPLAMLHLATSKPPTKIPKTISALQDTPGKPPILAQVNERISKVKDIIKEVAGEDAGIDVYFDPSEVHVTPDGRRIAVPSKYEGGRVKVNAAFANDEALLRGDIREELGHRSIGTEAGQKLLNDFLRDHPLTDAQLEELQRSGYMPGEGEAVGDYGRRMHDEFIAKQGRETMGWFRDMVDRFVIAAKETLGIDLTHDQAARSILRQLRTFDAAESGAAQAPRFSLRAEDADRSRALPGDEPVASPSLVKSQQKNATPEAAKSQALVALNRADPADLKAAADQYVKHGIGRGGFAKMIRKNSGRKAWEEMTPKERFDEFSDFAKEGFNELATVPAAKRLEYMEDRAMDFLDPMAKVYQILLKQEGYEFSGFDMKAPPDRSQLMEKPKRRVEVDVKLPSVTPSGSPAARDAHYAAQNKAIREAFAAKGYEITGQVSLGKIKDQFFTKAWMELPEEKSAKVAGPKREQTKSLEQQNQDPIVSAAFRKDGQIFDARDAGGITHMEADMAAEEAGVRVTEADAGFLTKSGKFLNREEAYEWAQKQRLINKEADTFEEGKLHTGKMEAEETPSGYVFKKQEAPKGLIDNRSQGADTAAGSTPAGLPSPSEPGRIAGVEPLQLKALQKSNIPASPDGTISAADASTRFSLREADKWLDEFQRNRVAREIYTEKELKDFAIGIMQTRKLFGDFSKVPEELKGTPVRKNSDPLFRRTHDLSTICPQQDQYLAVLGALERERGRIFTPHERFLVGEMMKDAGVSPACWYCYGQAGRNVFDYQISRAVEVFNKLVDETGGVAPTEEQLKAKFGTWNTKGDLAKFMTLNVPEAAKAGVKLDAVRVRDIARQQAKPANPLEAKLAEGLRKWAQAASLSNKPKPFSPYTNQILRMKQGLIELFNRSAGFRLNSQTDLRPWHVIDTSEFLAHMKMRGGMAHVYTRVPWFLDIFGETGIKFNMSIEFAHDPAGRLMRDASGKVLWNDMNGMPYEKAMEFRKRNKNAGTMLVAMTEEDLLEGLRNPEVDMIIPYHRGGVPKSVEQHLGVKDFSEQQHENWSKFKGDKTKGESVDGRSIEVTTVTLDNGRKVTLEVGGSITREQHLNSKADYIELCKKLNIEPRFKDYLKEAGYMKLVRDVARDPSHQTVVDPRKINWEAAGRFIDDWMKKGGQEGDVKPNPALLKLIRDRIENNEWPKNPAEDGTSTRYSLREEGENKAAPGSSEQPPEGQAPRAGSVSGAQDPGVAAPGSPPAISEATLTGEPRQTGLKHAMSDEERLLYGFTERPPTERKEMKAEWDRAGEVYQRNPLAGRDLTERFIEDPVRTALTSEDSAIMLRYKVDLENQLERANDRLFDATDTASKADAQGEVAQLKERLESLLSAVEKRGTEWGREGRWRQALASMDYSFTAQERRMRAANAGQEVDVEGLRKLVKEHQDRAEKWEAEWKKAQADQQRAAEEAAILKARIDAEVPPPHIQELLGKLRAKLKADADESRAYFKAKNGVRQAQQPGTRTSLRELKLDKDELFHLTRLAADNFMELGDDFAKWSSRMEEDLGEFAKIAKPEFKDIFERGKKMAHAAADQLGGKEKKLLKKAAGKVARTASQIDVAKMAGAIKEAQAEGPGKGEIGQYVKPIVRSVIEAGEMEHEAIFDKARQILKDNGVDLSTDDIKQAFSDYGIAEEAPKERVKVRMAQLRGEAQKLLGLKTVLEEGTPPKPTGQRRTKPSDLYRRTVQQINDTMKRLGVVATNPEAQLAGALDAMKTYRRNRIKDLRHEIATGTRIKKGRPVPLTDAELEALNKEYTDLKRQHDEVFPKQPITDEARLQLELKNLDREIEKLESDISNGKILPAEKPARLSTPELEAKRSRLKALRDQRAELRDLNQEFTNRKAAQALERRKEALYKRIDERKRQLASGDVEPKGERTNRPAHPELEPLQQELDALNAKIDELRNPPKTRDQIASQAAIRRASTMIAELEERMAKGDFEKRTKERPPVTLSKEAEKAIAALNETKLKFKQMELDYQLANQGPFARALNFVSSWKRTAVLSWPTILGKLTTAAAHGMWVGTVEDILAGGVGRVLPEGVRSKAIRYRGGTNLDIEIKAYSEMLRNLIHNYKSVMKTGEMPIDLKYGKVELMAPEFMSWVGHLHYALKSPLVQHEWTKSFEMLMRQAAKDGVDITTPEVQFAKGQQALRYAHERIFKEPNKFTEAYRAALRMMDRPSRATGKPSHLGQVAKTLAQFELPVVSIPTNIIKRAFEYAFGHWAGSYRLARALMNGIDNLPAEEADLIIRNFTRGSLGMAFQLYGWFAYTDVGGYYHEGDKRKPGDPKFGSLRIGEVEVPKVVLHHPLMEQIQIGATAHRVFNKMLKEHADHFSAMGSGAAAAIAGLIEEAPFAGQMKREVEGLAKPGKFLGEAVRSTIPGFIQWIAGRMDTDTGEPFSLTGEAIKRNPKTLGQHIEMGIPGRRDEVPAKLNR